MKLRLNSQLVDKLVDMLILIQIPHTNNQESSGTRSSPRTKESASSRTFLDHSLALEETFKKDSSPISTRLTTHTVPDLLRPSVSQSRTPDSEIISIYHSYIITFKMDDWFLHFKSSIISAYL